MNTTKPFTCIVSALGLLFNVATSAEAADFSLNLDIPKDPLPDKLTFAGITVWGTIDVGFVAQTAGTPLGSVYWGVNYLPVTAPVLNKPLVSLAPNATAVSSVGIKIDEDLWQGWRAIGAFDTGFNPLTGELADACASIVQANGKPASQTTWGDGSRCGQAFNGNAYLGLSHPIYGTLTVGRQDPFAAALWDYDPLAGSALSMIGWLPSLAGGQGVSEAGRWDNSIKYKFDAGPVHAGVMYTQGSAQSAIHGYGIGADIGATWRGFSIDGVYTHQVDGIVSTAFGVGGCGTALTPSCDTLSATAVNTDGLEILTKYVYEFGGNIRDGGPRDKLTFYAGYEQIKYMDPSDPQVAGDLTVNDYVLGSVNNTAYLFGQRVRQVGWGGVRYDTGPWSLELGYYHMHVPYYATSASSTPCSNASASNCEADSDVVSTMIHYAVNKHLDLYAGVGWNGYSGGLAAGATVTQATTFISGVKFSF